MFLLVNPNLFEGDVLSSWVHLKPRHVLWTNWVGSKASPSGAWIYEPCKGEDFSEPLTFAKRTSLHKGIDIKI